MTNSQSKFSQEDDVGNRLVFLTRVLDQVISDRDVIRCVLDKLGEYESTEHRHYHKVVYDLRKARHSRCILPTEIKCGIHLFRENYLQPKFLEKSYTVTEKIMLAKMIEKYRRWKYIGYIGCKRELKRIRDSIIWQESFHKKCGSKVGGCMLAIKDNALEHHPRWVLHRAESQTEGSHWTLGLKSGHTGRLIVEFIRRDYFGGMMLYLSRDHEMYSSGFWYVPIPKRTISEDYFVYLEDHQVS